MTTPLPRDQFPVTERWRYFNHAAVTPLPRVAVDAARRFLDEALYDGAVHWEEWDRQIERDSASGKLEKIFAEAREAHQQGKSTKF